MRSLMNFYFPGLHLQLSLTLMRSKCKPLRKIPSSTDAEHQVWQPKTTEIWVLKCILLNCISYMNGVLFSLSTSLLGFIQFWKHSKSDGWMVFRTIQLTFFFLLSQDLQLAPPWKEKLGWIKYCQTWSATVKLRSTSCAQVEISSRVRRSWRRLCLQTARRSGRRRGNETATPTPSSPRDRGDTEVFRVEDLPRGKWGQELSKDFSKLEFFYVTSFVSFLCVFCILAINILTLENQCAVRVGEMDKNHL